MANETISSKVANVAAEYGLFGVAHVGSVVIRAVSDFKACLYILIGGFS